MNIVNSVPCFNLGLHGKVGNRPSASSQINIPIMLAGAGQNYTASVDMSFGQQSASVPDSLDSITIALSPTNNAGVGASTIQVVFTFATGQVVNVTKIGTSFIANPFTFNVLQQNPIRFNLNIVVIGWGLPGTQLNFIITLSNRRVRKNLGV